MRPRNSLQQMANYNLRDRNAGSGTLAFPVHGGQLGFGKIAAPRSAAPLRCLAEEVFSSRLRVLPQLTHQAQTGQRRTEDRQASGLWNGLATTGCSLEEGVRTGPE